MKSIRRYISVLSSILAVMLAFGGCGVKKDVQATPTPIALPTATPAPVPVSGGALSIPVPRNPLSGAGPLSVNTEEMRNMYSLVYEPLLRLDAQNRLIPSLAEKWAADDTGRVWTIQLRKNVLWHSGAPLTADDVVYTYNQIKSLGDAGYYASSATAIETCEKVDDSTVRVTMAKSGLMALYALVFPVVCASTPGEVNGTGPYKVTSSSETAVELSANPGWWKQAPYIEQIHCYARESNDVALDSYGAQQLTMVPTSTVSAGRYREEGVTNVMDVMSQDAEVLLLNLRKGVLQSAEVRQAIAYAVNRSAIVSNVYMNHATVADVPVPPDSFLYDASTKIYDYNLDKAAALLKSAGYTPGADGILEKDGQRMHLKLLVNDSTESTYRKNAAALVADQLKAAGIEVEVASAKMSIGEENSEFAQKLVAGDFDLAMAGFSLEQSGNLSPYLAAGGARNYGGASDFEQELTAVANAADENGLKQAHYALQQKFVKELPFIMLYFRVNSIVYNANIKGVQDIRASDVFRTVSTWYIEGTAGVPSLASTSSASASSAGAPGASASSAGTASSVAKQ